jgi:exosortase family protein XrtM
MKAPSTCKFLLAFAAIYGALYLAYSVIPDSLLRDDVYYFGIVWPSKTAINWMAPGEHVSGVQNRLQSSAAELSIVRGCDGSGVIFLLVAAMVASRAGSWRTLRGILGAVVLIYVLNQMRVITLYFVDTHRPTWFTALHVYFIPTFMILIGTLYFAFWAATNRPHDDHSPAAA